MEKRTILIVEDEAAIAMDIEMRLIAMDFLIQATVGTPSDAIAHLQTEKPDLVLMDINLKGGDEGIDLAEEVMIKWQIPVVFLSAYTDSQTFSKAVSINPFGYVSKPFKDADLRNAIQLAIHNHANTIILPKKNPDRPTDSIFVKDGSGLIQLKFVDIQWIQAYDNYCKVHLTDEHYLVNLLLKEFDEKLPDYFIRVHRSFLVSAAHIHKISSDTIHIGGNEIPIGKVYKQKLLDFLNV